MNKFEDLVAFQRAVDLMAYVYELTEKFPREERYGMTAQMRSAALSVMRHLAEGQGRLSLGEWRQFLSQARASLYEVQSDAIGARRLGFVDEQQQALLNKYVARVASPLAGLFATF